MNKFKMLGLKTVSNVALQFAKGSVCQTSCAFMYQPKMNKKLRNRIKDK